MAIPLLHTVVTWLLKKRVHDIELFIKYPNEVQRDELMSLLQTAKKTEVGKQYGFADIQQYEGFADRVPIRTYEEIAPMIERSRQGEQNIFWPTPIKWYAKSSGTTNAKSKFIPISNESLEDLSLIHI